MTGVGILSAIIIGLLAGFIAEKVMNRSHGLLTNLIVGFVGAMIGSFLAGMLGVGYNGFIGSLIISTIGAIVLLLLLGAFRRRA